MRELTLGDILLGLEDLLKPNSDRLNALHQSMIGKAYDPILQKHLLALAALPEALTGRRPLTEQIAEANTLHDGLGRVFWNTTEATLNNPLASKARKDTALRLREKFLPALSYLALPHADEVFNAKQNRAHLAGAADDLKSFKTEEQNLYEIIVAFLDAADARGVLLSQQSSQEALSIADRTAATTLRPTVIGLLGNLRNALADDIKHNPALPENLEAQVFGFFDDILAKRIAANQAAAETRAKHKEEAKAKDALEAKQKAALAQVEADEKSKAAQKAQQEADKAQDEADAKPK